MGAKKLWTALFVVAIGALALGEGVEMRIFAVGSRSIGWFANTTGQLVTGLRITFDQPVTLLGKLEIGGFFQEVSGAIQGMDFAFQGKLANRGFVELRWQPIEAMPVLIVWLSEGKIVGKPFFGSLPAFIGFAAEGLVRLREMDPARFTAVIVSFFEANPALMAMLGPMGVSPELIGTMLALATIDELKNLLSTLSEMFQLETVEEFLGAFDWSAVTAALGL